MVQHSDKADKSIRAKGFTLVELIVVIVILAILAAILVPALLGYIDKAKDAQYILKAKNLITAAQAEFSELYAKDTMSLKIDTTQTSRTNSSGVITSIGAVTNDSTTYNVFLYGTQLANDIWETAGISEEEQPYVCIIGLGRSTEYIDDPTTAHKAYTVCWAMWWEDKNDPDTVMYWDGSEWTKKFDWGTGTYSYKPRKTGAPIIVNGENVYLQLYILKFINGHNTVSSLKGSDWTDLQNLFSK